MEGSRGGPLGFLSSIKKAVIGKDPTYAFFISLCIVAGLKLANIPRSWTLGALDNIEADPLTFGQGFETLCLDR